MATLLKFRIFLLVALAGGGAGCATIPPNYDAAKDLNFKKYKKIGVLVARMGNMTFMGCPAPIDLTTDYANRKAETGTTFLLDFAKKDVCLEDETRLKEYSFYHFPKWEYHSKGNSWVKYYKNITPQVYQTVADSLMSRGFVVVDIKALLKSRGKDFLNITTADILTEVRGRCDALMILHYTETGNQYFDYSTFFQSHKSSGYKVGIGISSLRYSFAVFDTKNSERILSVYEDIIDPKEVLLHDSEIKVNPALSSKIIVNESRRDSSLNSESSSEMFTHTFSEAEVLYYVLKAMKKGLAYSLKTDENEINIVKKGLIDYFN